MLKVRMPHLDLVDGSTERVCERIEEAIHYENTRGWWTLVCSVATCQKQLRGRWRGAKALPNKPLIATNCHGVRVPLAPTEKLFEKVPLASFQKYVSSHAFICFQGEKILCCFIC